MVGLQNGLKSSLVLARKPSMSAGRCCIGDPACLATSLEEFVGSPAYGLAQLHDDLERFTGLEQQPNGQWR
jgi:hypothetical protein